MNQQSTRAILHSHTMKTASGGTGTLLSFFSRARGVKRTDKPKETEPSALPNEPSQPDAVKEVNTASALGSPAKGSNSSLLGTPTAAGVSVCEKPGYQERSQPTSSKEASKEACNVNASNSSPSSPPVLNSSLGGRSVHPLSDTPTTSGPPDRLADGPTPKELVFDTPAPQVTHLQLHSTL